MIKKYKNYIILVGIIVILIGAYFLVSNLEGTQKNENKIDISNKESIFNIARDQIKTVKVLNQKGTYTLSYENQLKIIELPNVKADENKIDSLSYEVLEFKPESIVAENVENLSLYGLDKESISMTIEAKDGQKTKFVLGSVSPVGNGYYGMMENNKTVYIFATYKAELFLRDVSYYRLNEALSIDKNNVSEFTLEKNNGYSLKFVKNTVTDTETPNNVFAAYRMVSPYDWDAEGTEVSKLLDSVVDLATVDFVEDSLSNQSKYGFAPYQYKISVKHLDNKIDTIYLGNSYDHNFYVKINDVNGIYGVNNEEFTYLDLEPLAFLQKFAFIKNLDTVSKISYNHYGTAKATFEIKKVDEETHDIKKDGKVISESDFKALYTELISISTDGAASYTPSGNPYLTYEFTFTDGTTQIVHYYKMDDRRVALSVNGKIQFYVNMNELNQRLKVIDDAILKLQ